MRLSDGGNSERLRLMPWAFGRQGYARGDVANVLLAITEDGNTSICSTKATTCNIPPGRLAHRGGRRHGQ
jgi:formate dehydrogenase major subunit